MSMLLLSGILHFQAYKKFFQVYRRAIQLTNGIMPVYKNPVNQPSRIWWENEDRTIQDGRAEVRHEV